jgi:hypothetical protein
MSRPFPRRHFRGLPLDAAAFLLTGLPQEEKPPCLHS